MAKLYSIIQRQCKRQPDAPAIFWQNRTISFATLNNNIQRCCDAISACTKPGDRVAVLALNCPEYIELIYAVPAVNRILVPLNTRLATPALVAQIEQLDISLLIGDSRLVTPLIEQAAARLKTLSVIHFDLEQDGNSHTSPDNNPDDNPDNNPDKYYSNWRDNVNQTISAKTSASGSKKTNGIEHNSPAWLLFTSGTTGLPKAACLTDQSLFAAIESTNCGRPVLAGDRYLYPFPLFHVSAHNVLHQHHYGAAVALLPSFDAAAVLASCESLQITTMSLAPTMIAMLLDHPDFDAAKLASVRTIGYGASAINPALLNRVLNETACGLSQGFGMTELSGSAAFLDEAGHKLAATNKPQLLNSVGKPVPYVDIRIVDNEGKAVASGDAGEIIIRGKQVISGYWQQTELSAAAIIDGWLYTGDIGRFDKEGYLYIVDRKKDIIVSGGENIASREVEDTLCEYPGVKLAAVVGSPDSKWGETVCALIECAADTNIDSEALIDFCKQRLASYKAPKRVAFGLLPVNASGKLDKNAVRELFKS